MNGFNRSGGEPLTPAHNMMRCPSSSEGIASAHAGGEVYVRTVYMRLVPGHEAIGCIPTAGEIFAFVFRPSDRKRIYEYDDTG